MEHMKNAYGYGEINWKNLVKIPLRRERCIHSLKDCIVLLMHDFSLFASWFHFYCLKVQKSPKSRLAYKTFTLG